MSVDEPARLDLKTTSGLSRIVLDLLAEVERSIDLHGEQRDRPLGTKPWFSFERDRYQHIVDAGMADGSASWAMIVLEEVFEAMSETDPARVREELIQVLAVVSKMILTIDASAEETPTA